MSDIELFTLIFVVPVGFVLLCFLAYKQRHSYPRTVLFFYCALVLGLGLFLLNGTYQEFTNNRVSVVLLKNSTPYNKFDSPTAFIIGLVLNLAVILLCVGLGISGIYKSITKVDFRFKG